MKPKALIIAGYGINCEEETSFVFEKTGSESEIIHINDLIEKPTLLNNFQILAFPGGFSFGDDLGSGVALASKIKNKLIEEILSFVKKDKLVIGICNGFQVLVNLGLVPATDQDYTKSEATLMHNASVRYQCRWVHLKNTSKKCIWTKGIEVIHVPVAHGEGNFYCKDEILKKLKENDQLAFQYCDEEGNLAKGKFPLNPNGALEDIAGVCDPSGRIFGLMPHPERFNSFTNENGWELKKEKLIREGKEIPTKGDGLKIFENAAKYFN